MRAKGYMFTMDAVLAATLLFSGIIAASLFYIHVNENTETKIGSDVLTVFANVRVMDINNPFIAELIANGNISDLNNTVIEQIGEFASQGNYDLASRLILNLTEGITDADFAVYFDDDLIYGTPSDSPMVVSSRRMVSGIQLNKTREGYTSRVIITGVINRTEFAFVYFEGFEGEGNLTKFLFIPEGVSAESAYMELEGGGDFNLYVNGQFSGSYVKGSAGGGYMMADKWIINNTYLQNFNTGKNTITLNFSGGISYISGGYLRVGYKTIARPYTASNMTFWLPGINGIINLYSAFYVPGNITGMNISLHYFSNYSIMMMIGNKTVFEDDNATGESYADVTNETLYSILKYDELSMKSVPIRLGLKQIANISTDTGNADVVLITDLSGSMNWRLNSDNNGNTVTNCSSPSLYLSTTKRISLAKCLDKNFVAIVLNTTGNRIALVGFARDANTYYRGLTDNLSLVTADINSYPNSPSGGTCICCAINRAFNIIGSRNASRQRFIIVMSDGIPTYKCVNNGDCTNGPYEGNLTTGYPLWACCGGGEDNCDDNQCWQSTGSANYSVRRAATELDAEVDSIGFGPVKSCAFANATLRGIAEIGNGTYSSSSNSSELDEIYAKLAKHIVSLSYVEQTANITGKLLPSVLYPDSYIHFNYNPSVAEIEFNRIPITVESMPAGNNISEVRVYIPPDSLVISAKATSYSANKWTANVSVSNIAGVTTAYLLSEYGKSFVPLGDPFTVDIPGSLFVSGVNNTVTTITGVNPKNLTGGSVDNRLIYTMLLTGSVDYDRVFKRADGCRWRLDFEDGSNQTFNAPPLYNGSKSCYYINGGYDSGDAVDDAVYRLLSRLDVDGDGLVDVTIRGDQLAIEAFAIPNVPSLWGPGIVEVRVWAR